MKSPQDLPENLSHVVGDWRIASPIDDPSLIALDETLAELSDVDPGAAELVQPRYLTGLIRPQPAEALRYFIADG